MKNYIAPKSTLLALNLSENIARSIGDIHLPVTYDVHTRLVINTDGVAYTDYNRTQLVLKWLQEHSQDTTFECL